VPPEIVLEFASRAAKLERAAAATGTDGEQKLQNNRTIPDAAWDK
jgi:hypothetical protein